jgi:hypothetical protein
MCVRKNARMHVKRHRPALRPGDLFIFVDEVTLLRWRRRAAASWRSRFGEVALRIQRATLPRLPSSRTGATVRIPIATAIWARSAALTGACSLRSHTRSGPRPAPRSARLGARRAVVERQGGEAAQCPGSHRGGRSRLDRRPRRRRTRRPVAAQADLLYAGSEARQSDWTSPGPGYKGRGQKDLRHASYPFFVRT